MREPDDASTRALVAVRGLQAAYGDAVTRRAWEEVRLLFEPDAVVHIDTRTRDPFTLEGPEALVEFIERAVEPFAFFELAILNAVAEVDGDAATGRVHLCKLRHGHDGEWSQAVGVYQDRYQRRDNAWRIAERRYSSLARTRAGEVESFPWPEG